MVMGLTAPIRMKCSKCGAAVWVEIPARARGARLQCNGQQHRANYQIVIRGRLRTCTARIDSEYKPTANEAARRTTGR